jgi:hypothetical protein
MGWWFIVAWLDAGVPSSAMLYTYDKQRCLQIVSEHLEAEQMRPGSYVEIIYANCIQGGAPRL